MDPAGNQEKKRSRVVQTEGRAQAIMMRRDRMRNQASLTFPGVQQVQRDAGVAARRSGGIQRMHRDAQTGRAMRVWAAAEMAARE